MFTNWHYGMVEFQQTHFCKVNEMLFYWPANHVTRYMYSELLPYQLKKNDIFDSLDIWTKYE